MTVTDPNTRTPELEHIQDGLLDTHHGDNRVDVTLASYTGDPFVISFDHTDIVTVKVPS